MRSTTLPDAPGDLDPLVALLRDRRAAVLVGAGCSTESGIPDYRGPEGSLRSRRPIQFREFSGSEEARARYWARSAVGWPRIAAARPNPAHRALAALEAEGRISGLITQNVDGLHHAAGSRRVVELHGSLAAVRCLSCDELSGRDAFQRRLRDLNPGWAEAVDLGVSVGEAETAPDGDAEVPAWAVERFRVPTCESCGGTVKPDVVFFGENVPPRWVADAWRVFEDARALLVVGSSLTVYSGRRFVYRAQKEGMPIGIVNLGPTRADEMAAARVEGRLGLALPRLVEALRPRL